jgi:ABC-type transporter Mla maintaining outer membrane lipid asymmetry ATPase subunit MlaF
MTSPAEQHSPPLIEMRGVTLGALRDADRVVAADVNWTVARGDFWVVGGWQGAGKSDFLMTTAGLLAPRAGNYRLFGEPMPIFEEPRLAERLRLGLVFDGGQLLNQLTVFENVALPLHYHRNLPREAIEPGVREVLEVLELSPWAASTPGAMPRPWRKRAGLARALMLQPEILLVDGALSGADRRHARWWLNFLSELNRGHALLNGRPVTLVATTEDFRPWRTHARQFAVLAEQCFTALGDWAAVERCELPTVRALFESQAAGQGVV